VLQKILKGQSMMQEDNGQSQGGEPNIPSEPDPSTDPVRTPIDDAAPNNDAADNDENVQQGGEPAPLTGANVVDSAMDKAADLQRSREEGAD
jgi:hypothetical protein